jgi:inhibitor of cysteine peptidase
MTQYTLGDSQDGTTLSLRIGDVVVLRLAENPTTGYRWEITTAEGFELEADDFTHTPASTPGSGGERALRFKATAPGLARIETVLRRSWETTVPLRQYSAAAEIH